jgi:hypothetical protein
MSSSGAILWVVATKSSFQVDLDWNLYFAPRSRPYEEHHYIGIYHDGAVRAVGREQSVLDVDGDTHNPRLVTGREPREEGIRRIEGAVEDAWERFGWDIGAGYRFFLVDSFRETRFVPAFEIDGPRYVDLEEWIPKVPRRTERLALELAGRRWS